MTTHYRSGAVGALLDIYDKAIHELVHTIADLSESELIQIVDHQTSDPNCRSVQSVLSHVVAAGFAYAVDIRQLMGEAIAYPSPVIRSTIAEYRQDLQSLFAFTVETFESITDHQLEEFDHSKKIKTPWGQVYDIEQLTEHAIVHVLRHIRQIEKFKQVMRSRNEDAF
jgi:hypothetical protein